MQLDREIKRVKAEEKRLQKVINDLIDEENAKITVSRQTSYSDFYHLEDEYGRKIAPGVFKSFRRACSPS